MHKHVIDGIEIELDDDVDISDIDKGLHGRDEGEVDLDALERQAEADADREDDEADDYVYEPDDDEVIEP